MLKPAEHRAQLKLPRQHAHEHAHHHAPNRASSKVCEGVVRKRQLDVGPSLVADDRARARRSCAKAQRAAVWSAGVDGCRLAWRGFEEAPPGFEPGMADLQSTDVNSQVQAEVRFAIEAEIALAHSLAQIPPIDPDLPRLVESWPELPAPIRAG